MNNGIPGGGEVEPADHLASVSHTPVDAHERALQRRRVLKAGVIAYNARHTTLPCAVRDITQAGACIRVEGSIACPDTFELIVPIDGLEASCQVAWRKGQEVGVQFLGDPHRGVARRTQVVDALVPPRKISLRRKPRPGESL